MRTLTLVVLGLGATGCLDFVGALEKCRADGRCAAAVTDAGEVDADDGGLVAVRPLEGGLCANEACWENPFPVGVPITALASPTPGELYVGGTMGTLVHLKGREVTLSLLGRPSPPQLVWQRVMGFAACSSGLTVGLFDGQLFVSRDGGVTPLPLAFGASTIVEGWSGPDSSCALVGNRGASTWAALEQGGRLTPLRLPLDARRIQGVGGTSLADLWLVSADELLQVDGDGGLVAEPVTPDGGLTGVCSLGQGDVYLSSAQGVRSRRLGWNALGAQTELSAIACVAPDRIAAVGEDLVRQCSNLGACSDIAEPGSWHLVTQAGGQLVVGSRSGELALVTDGALTRLSSGVRTTLNDVTVTTEGEAWAVGAEGTVLRRADGGWVVVDAGVTDELFAVAALADGRVIIGGRGGLMRVFLTDGGVDKPRFYDGARLIQNQALGSDIRRVRQGPQNVWALATGGVLLREDADGAWRKVPNPGTSSNHWYDLRFNDAGVGWVTGAGAGVIELQRDGTWKLIRGPFATYTFLAVHVDREGRTWFGGANGLGMRLNTDGGQSAFTFPGTVDTVVAFLEQPDSLYAIGQRTLYRFAAEPLQWEILGPLPLDPVDNAPQAVVALGDDFLVVGRNGAIVRVNRAHWLRSP